MVRGSGLPNSVRWNLFLKMLLVFHVAKGVLKMHIQSQYKDVDSYDFAAAVQPQTDCSELASWPVEERGNRTERTRYSGECWAHEEGQLNLDTQTHLCLCLLMYSKEIWLFGAYKHLCECLWVIWINPNDPTFWPTFCAQEVIIAHLTSVCWWCSWNIILLRDHCSWPKRHTWERLSFVTRGGHCDMVCFKRSSFVA